MTGRQLGMAVLTGHGLAHLVGVVLLWRLGRPGWLQHVDLSPAPGSGSALALGALWLAAAVLFVLAGAALRRRRSWWHRVALVAVVASGAALLPSASTAAVGLVVDWILFVVVIMAGARDAQRAPSPSPSASS